MVYLDNAASTPPAPEVVAALAHAAETHFANPSSAHGLGAAASRALEEARATIASWLRGESAEITFTSGGTEANALGVLGAAEVARGRHAVVSGLEHPSVLRNVEALRGRGWEVSVVAPAADMGVVTAGAVAAAVRTDTALVAVMLVNNELGTVQPVADIARAARGTSAKVHVHVDAVQAAGLVPVSVRGLGADSVAVSAHKLHGPKGVGALWVRTGGRVAALWAGGGQENARRSGTEGLPAIIAFAQAVRSLDPAAAPRIEGLRNDLEAGLIAARVGTRPTVGGPRAPHICSVVVPDLPAEPLLHALESRGVYAAAGSACASRSKGPSHVLRAVGVRDEDAVLRFSLSRFTRSDDIAQAVAAFAAATVEIAAVAPAKKRAGGRA